MKALMLLLFTFFKSAKLAKFFLSAATILLSIGTYTMMYGWQYGVGFVALILIHEMGHYFAAREKNLEVGLPTFIPFVGAWIQLKEQPMNAEVEAYVAYAGPFVGSIAAFGLYFLGKEYHSGLLMALAQAGFLINLFNLIPISPLDGGRITAIISPRIWLLGAPLLVALWFFHPSPMLILVAILSYPQLVKAWKYKPDDPANKSYYGIDPKVKFEYTVLYLILVSVLGLMII
jgi:Zn-dependent protease